MTDTEALLAWWHDAHDLAEAKRLQHYKAMKQAYQHIEACMEAEELVDMWRNLQKARRVLRKELQGDV